MDRTEIVSVIVWTVVAVQKEEEEVHILLLLQGMEGDILCIPIMVEAEEDRQEDHIRMAEEEEDIMGLMDILLHHHLIIMDVMDMAVGLDMTMMGIIEVEDLEVAEVDLAPTMISLVEVSFYTFYSIQLLYRVAWPGCTIVLFDFHDF